MLGGGGQLADEHGRGMRNRCAVSDYERGAYNRVEVAWLIEDTEIFV